MNAMKEEAQSESNECKCLQRVLIFLWAEEGSLEQGFHADQNSLRGSLTNNSTSREGF